MQRSQQPTVAFQLCVDWIGQDKPGPRSRNRTTGLELSFLGGLQLGAAPGRGPLGLRRLALPVAKSAPFIGPLGLERGSRGVSGSRPIPHVATLYVHGLMSRCVYAVIGMVRLVDISH